VRRDGVGRKKEKGGRRVEEGSFSGPKRQQPVLLPEKTGTRRLCASDSLHAVVVQENWKVKKWTAAWWS
jgi:hypothetical protein